MQNLGSHVQSDQPRKEITTFNKKIINKTMAWKCPECQEEITYLNYNVSTSSCEYGTARLYDEKRLNPIADYEYDDSGDNEWNGDAQLECPECDEEIRLNRLIWQDEEDEEEEEDEEKKEIEKIEIINSGREDRSSRITIAGITVICPKCKKVIVCGNRINSNTEYVECDCGEMILR